MCPALCAASTSVSAPTARAFSQSSATGLIVPSELETWVKAKSFTSGVSNDGSCSSASVPSSRTGTKRSRAPVRSRQQLPRHEVAVMLHFGEQDHVARAKKFSAPRLRDEIDALGRAAGEDDLVGARRADVVRDALPRVFVSFRRARAQLVQAAMHIGVVVLVVIPQRIEHRAAASAMSRRYRSRSRDGRAPARAGSGNPRG